MAELNNALATALMDQIKKAGPKFFEKTVVHLIAKWVIGTVNKRLSGVLLTLQRTGIPFYTVPRLKNGSDPCILFFGNSA